MIWAWLGWNTLCSTMHRWAFVLRSAGRNPVSYTHLNNAGIYKLNTSCNDDPDIIPLLNTPAPCAFERDENGAVSYTHLVVSLSACTTSRI